MGLQAGDNSDKELVNDVVDVGIKSEFTVSEDTKVMEIVCGLWGNCVNA